MFFKDLESCIDYIHITSGNGEIIQEYYDKIIGFTIEDVDMCGNGYVFDDEIIRVDSESEFFKEYSK